MTRVFDPLAATLLLVACLSAESVPIMLGLIAAAGALAAIRKAASRAGTSRAAGRETAKT